MHLHVDLCRDLTCILHSPTASAEDRLSGEGSEGDDTKFVVRLLETSAPCRLAQISVRSQQVGVHPDNSIVHPRLANFSGLSMFVCTWMCTW